MNTPSKTVTQSSCRQHDATPDRRGSSKSSKQHDESLTTVDDPTSTLPDSSAPASDSKEDPAETLDKYSWEAWLRSTKPIDDGNIIVIKQHYGGTVGPKEDYGTDPDVIDGLCIMCRWLLDHLRLTYHHFGDPKDDLWINVNHWSTNVLLRESARNGCGLCEMIVQREPRAFSEELPLQITISSRESIDLQLQIVGLSTFWETRCVYLDLFTTEASKPEVQDQYQNTLEFPELHRALCWLNECETEHGLCKKRNQNYELPTRLLEIHPEFIRLRETSEIPHNTKYTTLSHCWGVGGVKYMLTTALLVKFKDGITRDLLPKTFRDAILITKMLGIHYLWIDSLCIIQDDPEDWRKESVKMSDVYGNCRVTIAASWARNSSEGCFNNTGTKVKRLQVNTTALKDEKICFQSLEVTPRDMVTDSITRSVLAKRSWVLQERLLSPRTLYFTNSQLFWECDMQLACESFPKGVPSFTNQSDDYIQKSNLLDHWNSILVKYTRCGLTNRRDVLVALSGIIRKLQQQKQDICFAGIWRLDAEAQLLWMRAQHDKVLWVTVADDKEETQKLYTAPSWSWAASPGEVSPFISNGDTLAYSWVVDILSMEVIPVGGDPLGELRGGSLSIACRSLLKAKVLSRSTNNKIFELQFNEVGQNITGKSASMVYFDTKKSSYVDIFLLPFHYRSGVRDLLQNGLILIQIEGSTSRYQRVGCFRCYLAESERDRLEQNRSPNCVGLGDIISDTRYGLEPKDFQRVISHGDEQWGVIEII